MLVYIVYVEYYTLSLFQDRVRDNLLANGRKYNGHVHVMYMKAADSCLKSQLTDSSMHLHVFHFTCKMQIFFKFETTLNVTAALLIKKLK